MEKLNLSITISIKMTGEPSERKFPDEDYWTIPKFIYINICFCTEDKLALLKANIP